MKSLVCYIACIFLFLSCQKTDDRRCWKSEGNVVTLTREFSSSFFLLTTRGSVEVHLVQDTVNYLKLTCGEHLAKQITTEVQDEKLTIENHNKCNFLRPKQSVPIVELHYIILENIDHEASETIKTINTLKAENFFLYSGDNGTQLNFDIDVTNFACHTSDTYTNIKVSGKAKSSVFSIKGNSACEAQDLQQVGKVVVISRTMGDIKLGEIHQDFTVDIRAKGNVYYSGNPTNIKLIDTSEGELIKM